MNVSLNWLKDYLKIDQSTEEICKILTSIGLEVGGYEEFEAIKGGLKGLVIGHVLTCEAHPDSDHLHVTTVDLGTGEPEQIVCGAPNVAAGQKVVVATVGTTLYKGDEEFVIKKSKIRGVASNGMICAEDEIGIGTDHAGIMVLPENTPVGIPAADYFNVYRDTIIEVDITPNRIDGASHLGVARDLAAYLQQRQDIHYTLPSVEAFQPDSTDAKISVRMERPEACRRYAGICIEGVEVKPSPEWLQNRMKAIGLHPINNIVDVTNYILFLFGQPLHAFDLDKLKNADGVAHIVVRAAAEGAAMPKHVRSLEPAGIERVHLIDASPVGANVRSTVATYSGVLDDLRRVYAKTPAAQERGKHTFSPYRYRPPRPAAAPCR